MGHGGADAVHPVSLQTTRRKGSGTPQPEERLSAQGRGSTPPWVSYIYIIRCAVGIATLLVFLLSGVREEPIVLHEYKCRCVRCMHVARRTLPRAPTSKSLAVLRPRSRLVNTLRLSSSGAERTHGKSSYGRRNSRAMSGIWCCSIVVERILGRKPRLSLAFRRDARSTVGHLWHAFVLVSLH